MIFIINLFLLRTSLPPSISVIDNSKKQLFLISLLVITSKLFCQLLLFFSHFDPNTEVKEILEAYWSIFVTQELFIFKKFPSNTVLFLFIDHKTNVRLLLYIEL